MEYTYTIKFEVDKALTEREADDLITSALVQFEDRNIENIRHELKKPGPRRSPPRLTRDLILLGIGLEYSLTIKFEVVKTLGKRESNDLINSTLAQFEERDIHNIQYELKKSTKASPKKSSVAPRAKGPMSGKTMAPAKTWTYKQYLAAVLENCPADLVTEYALVSGGFAERHAWREHGPSGAPMPAEWEGFRKRAILEYRDALANANLA